MAQNNHIMQSYTDVLVVNDGAGGGHEYRGIAPIHVDNLDDTISADCKPIEINYPLSGNLSDEKFSLGFEPVLYDYRLTFSSDSYTHVITPSNSVVSTNSISGTYGAGQMRFANSDASNVISLNGTNPLLYMKDANGEATLSVDNINSLKANKHGLWMYDNTVVPQTGTRGASISVSKQSDGYNYLSVKDADNNDIHGYLLPKNYTETPYRYNNVYKTIEDFDGQLDANILADIFSVPVGYIMEGTVYVSGLNFSTSSAVHGQIIVETGDSSIIGCHANQYDWDTQGTNDIVSCYFYYNNNSLSTTDLRIRLIHSTKTLQDGDITIRFNGCLRKAL